MSNASLPTSITAAVLKQTGSPLEIVSGIKVPELRRGQVLVKVIYAGVCHSQLMEVRGKRGEDKWLPHLLGHEGTGEVMAVGEGVSKVKAGDQVVLGWIKGDGIEAGGAQYEGPHGETINSGGVTTFSDYTVVSENRLVSLPSGTPTDLGVLYGCALPTGAGIVLNELKPEADKNIAVFGLGGIGISALMAANMYSPKKLIAIDMEESKLELARQLGATDVINCASQSPLDAIMALTDQNGVDYAVEAAGKSKTIEQAFEMVKRGGGRCIFASHPSEGEKISIDPYELICGKSIQGSWGGGSKPDRDIPLLGQYYEEGKLNLQPLLSNTYELTDINQALDDLEARKIVRALIKVA